MPALRFASHIIGVETAEPDHRRGVLSRGDAHARGTTRGRHCGENGEGQRQGPDMVTLRLDTIGSRDGMLMVAAWRVVGGGSGSGLGAIPPPNRVSIWYWGSLRPSSPVVGAGV